MSINELNMDLQLFADGTAATTEPNTKTEPEVTGEDKKTATPDTYTQEQVDEMLQKEADRRVSAARKKFEAELRDTVDKERKEAEKLAKMSEEEKSKFTLEEQRLKLEQREGELLQKELKLEAVKILSDKKLPIAFVDLLVNSDAETTMKNIDVFETSFRQAVSEAVDKQLGATKKPGKGSSSAGITSDQFMKMGYHDRNALMRTEPDLYNKLLKELNTH